MGRTLVGPSNHSNQAYKFNKLKAANVISLACKSKFCARIDNIATNQCDPFYIPVLIGLHQNPKIVTGGVDTALDHPKRTLVVVC